MSMEICTDRNPRAHGGYFVCFNILAMKIELMALVLLCLLLLIFWKGSQDFSYEAI